MICPVMKKTAVVSVSLSVNAELSPYNCVNRCRRQGSEERYMQMVAQTPLAGGKAAVAPVLRGLLNNHTGFGFKQVFNGLLSIVAELL